MLLISQGISMQQSLTKIKDPSDTEMAKLVVTGPV